MTCRRVLPVPPRYPRLCAPAHAYRPDPEVAAQRTSGGGWSTPDAFVSCLEPASGHAAAGAAAATSSRDASGYAGRAERPGAEARSSGHDHRPHRRRRRPASRRHRPSAGPLRRTRSLDRVPARANPRRLPCSGFRAILGGRRGPQIRLGSSELVGPRAHAKHGENVSAAPSVSTRLHQAAPALAGALALGGRPDPERDARPGEQSHFAASA